MYLTFGFTSGGTKPCERSEHALLGCLVKPCVGPSLRAYAALPAHGLMRRRTGASAFAATSVS